MLQQHHCGDTDYGVTKQQGVLQSESAPNCSTHEEMPWWASSSLILFLILFLFLRVRMRGAA